MAAPTSATQFPPLRSAEGLTLAELRELPYSPRSLGVLRLVGMSPSTTVARWPDFHLSTRREDSRPTSKEIRRYRRCLVFLFSGLYGGRCSGCGRFTPLREMVLDHDHSTGKVRGALCVSCNNEDALAEAAPAPREIIAEHGLLIRVFEPTDTNPGRWELPNCCLCEGPEHFGIPCENGGEGGRTSS